MENKNIGYILDNIISKATYNEQTDMYEIKEEDYIHLNLTSKQKSLLNKMCNKLGIKLEYIPYTKDLLPVVENEELFQEYNSIKQKIETTQAKEEKEILEQRRIELRNQICKDNMGLVNAIIERRINKLDNLKDYEDIIQIAYEILLEYIDNNELYKGQFKERISRIILLYTKRRILYDTEAIGENTKKYIEEINRAKGNSEALTLSQLSSITNLSQKKIEELLKLENIVKTLSLEEQINLINSTNYNDSSIIYENPFESILIKQQREKIISRIILTLPKIEQEILILYFGFNGQSYNQEEIAKMYRTTKSYISLIMNKALDTIKTSVRINYLKELYEVPKTYQEVDQTSNKHLEEFLIRNLSQETIESIKPYLTQKVSNFLEVYTKENEYTLKELSEVLQISIPQVYKLKTKTLSSIRYIISNQLNEKSKQKITYEEYVNYLMHLWMHKDTNKRRKR